MDDKNFEEVFKRGLYHLEEKPDVETWAFIQRRLRQSKSRKTFLIVFAAAAAVVGILTFVGVEYGKEVRDALSGVNHSGETREVADKQSSTEGTTRDDAEQSRHADGSSETPLNQATPPDRIAATDPGEQRKSADTNLPARRPAIASKVQEDVGKDIRYKTSLSRDQPANMIATYEGSNPDNADRVARISPQDSSAVHSDSVNLADTGVTQYDKSEGTVEEKHSPFAPRSILLSAGPLFTYQNFEANPHDEVYLRNMESTGAVSRQRLGLRMHGGVEWKLSRKLAVALKLLYQEARYQGSFDVGTFTNGSVEYYSDSDTLVITPVEQAAVVLYRQSRREIGGTADVQYELRRARARHSLGIGLNYTQYRNREFFGDGTSYRTKGNASYMSVSYNLEYPISRVMFLLLQPYYVQEIGARNLAPEIVNRAKTQYWGVQLGTGFQLR